MGRLPSLSNARQHFSHWQEQGEGHPLPVDPLAAASDDLGAALQRDERSAPRAGPRLSGRLLGGQVWPRATAGRSGG